MEPRRRTWATSDRFVPRTFVRPFWRFSQVEASSGLVLLGAAVVALIWANSPWADSYHALFEDLRLELSFGAIHLDESFGELINDGMMAVFFFVVGLEIKRELVLGELHDPKAAALPVLAALGGMVVPALIYVAFNAGTGPEAMRGWGIPMATDIAFAVGVLALLGKRVPAAGKLFILALAIADDLGAILVIAIFYTADLRLGWLGAALAGLAVVAIGQRVHIRSLAFYVPVAVAIWFALLESGVHATLAGVALGFLTPARAHYSGEELEASARQVLDMYPLGPDDLDEEKSDHEARLLAEIATESVAPLARLEHKLLPWSSFVVIPLFALANAGVSFEGIRVPEAVTHPVALGVAVGLVVGKTVGISLFVWLAVRLGLGRLPTLTSWHHIIGLAAVGGIGFTVSLFVTGLAFTSDDFTDIAKIGIFLGSAVAGVIGTCILLTARPLTPSEAAPSP